MSILNLYSQYTKPEGSIKFNDLFNLARKLYIKTIALTDHGNFCGMLDFYKSAVAHGIKPIIGFDTFYQLKDGSFVRLVLYFRNSAGYREGLAFVKELSQSSDGYLYLTKGLTQFKADQIICLVNTYKSDYYSEIVPISSDFATIMTELNEFATFNSIYFQLINDQSETSLNQTNLLIKRHNENNLPLLCTNPVYYLEDGDQSIKDFLLNHYLSKNRNHHLRNQSLTNGATIPDFFPLIASQNREKVIRECNFILEKEPFRFPKISFHFPDKNSALDEIKVIIDRNLNYYYADDRDLIKLMERVDYELSILERDNLTLFFYFIYQFKERFVHNYDARIYFGGRVSYFFIAYLLKLTAASTLTFKTNYSKAIFETTESYPVIIINVATHQKENLVSLFKEIFGEDKLCALSEFVQWNASSLISTMGKQEGLEREVVENILKKIPAKYRFEPLKNILRIGNLREIIAKSNLGNELLRYACLLDETCRVINVNQQNLVLGYQSIEQIIPVHRQERDDDNLTSFFDLATAHFFGLWSIQIHTHKSLDLLEKVAPKDIFLDEKTIIFWANQLIKEINTSQIDFYPYFFYREDKLPFMELSKNNPLYRLAIYLESYHLSLDQFKSDDSHNEAVSTSLLNELKPTAGKILFYEQLIFVIEKLFKEKSYAKAKQLLYNSKNLFSFKKNLQNLISNKSDQNKVKWLNANLFPTVFMSNLKDNAFKIFMAIKTAMAIDKYPTKFYTTAFVEALNGQSGNYDKYIREVKKLNIKIMPILHSNCVNKAYFDQENSCLYLSLFIIKGISATLANYIASFCQQNRINSLLDFQQKIDKTKVLAHHFELLAKVGFFDQLNHNRKQSILYLRELNEIKEINQDELFPLDEVIREADDIVDYTILEKQELEEKLTDFVFTQRVIVTNSDFTDHLILNDNLLILYFQKMVKDGKRALFMDLNERQYELNIPENFIHNEELPYLVELSLNQQTILRAKTFKNPWSELEYSLSFTFESKESLLLKEFFTTKDDLNRCYLKIYFSDLNVEFKLQDGIFMNKTKFKEFRQLLAHRPYYLELLTSSFLVS